MGKSGNPAFLPIALIDFSNPLIAIVTLGMPIDSAVILARVHAAVQLPHPPLPDMTASIPHFFSFSGKA